MAKVPPLGFSTEEIRDELNEIRHPFRIAVDRAKNPFNIGSIVRTAHSFLAKEIILIGSEPWYERAAMGMQKFENIVEIETVEAFLEYAAASKSPLIVFEKDVATEGMWDADIPEDAILVFGNENDGTCKEIVDAADAVVAIPMYGINHSYPISIAAGIAMAEWARRWRNGSVVSRD